MTAAYERVWAVLLDHVGRHHAISGPELAYQAGLAGDRELRLVVHEARVERKLPILSAPGVGYYRPETPAEVDAFYYTLREHAIEELAVAAVVRRFGSERIREARGDDWIEDFVRMHYGPRQGVLPGLGHTS